MSNNFISSKDYDDEKQIIYSKQDNIKIMTNDRAKEVITEIFKLLINRYQNNFESVKGSEFVFDYVDLLYYKSHSLSLNHRVSNIDTCDCIKNKKATINPINIKDNKCFQYTVAVALNHEEIKGDTKNNTN